MPKKLKKLRKREISKTAGSVMTLGTGTIYPDGRNKWFNSKFQLPGENDLNNCNSSSQIYRQSSQEQVVMFRNFSDNV